MRVTIWSFLCLFFSISGVASECPGLTGEYSCRLSQNSDLNVVLANDVADGKTVYRLSTSHTSEREIFVDRSWNAIDLTELRIADARYFAFCQSGELRISIQGNFKNRMGSLSFFDISSTLTNDVDGLKIVSDGIIDGNWGSIPIDDNVRTCTPTDTL